MRTADRVVLLFAVASGLAIAYVDSRPHWDDAAITAFALFASAAVAGFAAPRYPWLWALGVGIWIPMHAVATSLTAASAAMLVVLAFPLAGAWAGSLLRSAQR